MVEKFGRITARGSGGEGRIEVREGCPGAVTVWCVIYFLHEHLKQVGKMSG